MTEGYQQRVSRIYTLGTTLGGKSSRSNSPSNAKQQRSTSPINVVSRNDRRGSSNSRLRSTTGRSPLDGSNSASGSAKPSPAKNGSSRTNTPREYSGREHLKRPGGETNSMPRNGKKSKLSHDLTGRDGGLSDPSSANSTPRRSRRTLGTSRGGTIMENCAVNRSRSPRPQTPETVHQHEQKIKKYTSESIRARKDEKGKEVNLFASPISRAKRNAKVPQLYLSAGTTPPPSQIYKSKKRIQKRILVMAGSQEPLELIPESSDLSNQRKYSPDPVLNLSLPPAPNLEELSRTDNVHMDIGSDDYCNERINDLDQEDADDLGLLRKSIDAEDMCEFSKEYQPRDKGGGGGDGGGCDYNMPSDAGNCNVKDDLNESLNVGSLVPLQHDEDDLAFLYLRHQPVSDTISGTSEELKSDGTKKLSILEVKEGIKKALSLPLGYEASLIGEILSRDTADGGYCDALSSSDSPSTGRRISAPVLSRSPLAKWKHSKEIRRVSEGAVPLDKENSGPWVIQSRDETIETKPRESLVVPITCDNNNNNKLMRGSHDEQPPPQQLLQHQQMNISMEDNTSSSTAPFDGSGGTPPADSRMEPHHQRRTLDEPEECEFTNVQKPCRRRSISEPHGRTGGPGGVMGSAIKEAIASAYFTLNPSIFEDRRVWGVSEFKKLCMMINVDTSKCREYNDYVSLLQEWNHKPNVAIGLNARSISSTYHAGDIQATPCNFNNIPILSSKVPTMYRRAIEPLPMEKKLGSCLSMPESERRGKSPRLHFSPYNHNCQFYLSAEERYEKRLCLHEIASMTSIANNEEGVDAQVILLDPTRELNGDPDWEYAKTNMRSNLIRTNPNYILEEHLDLADSFCHSHDYHTLKVNEIANSQEISGESWLQSV